MNAIGTTPPGFVFVAGGPFRAGGDPIAYGAWPKSTRDVGDFWIGEREITEREWIEFLEDPATQAEIAASPTPIRVPRTPANEMNGGEWKLGPDGRYDVPFAANGYPVRAISPDDARAFAAWRSRKAREAGEAFEYALPTEEEWEKAARGVDGRAFVFGDHYSPSWMKSLFARDGAPPYDRYSREPGLRFPIDESVFGVYDLAGSEWECCADDAGDVIRGAAVRGGAETFLYEASFHAAARAGVERAGAQSVLGLRLVAHRARTDGEH
jgi:serine/threonine-protein kinase